jgi:hypothetical protein
MEQNKFKSTLGINRIKNEMGYISVNNAVNKHQKNVDLVKSGTDAAEKALIFIVLVNVMLSLLLLTANNIDKATFNKDFILNIISQFNIFLPLVMAIPIIVTIVKSFIFDNDEDKKLNFSVIGRIVGTATILTLVPFISIVMTYVIKTQLI